MASRSRSHCWDRYGRSDAATGDATQLTYDKNYHSSPGWSPDGKWLLYTSDDNNRKIQLQILNVASGHSAALTNDDHLYLDPVFSPDGSRVAYVSRTRTGISTSLFDRSGMVSGPDLPSR